MRLRYTYKHPSVWTIPRFGHEKGPLVFRVLESIPRFGKFCMNTEMEISNIWGVRGAEPPEKILPKMEYFSLEKMLWVPMTFIGKNERFYIQWNFPTGLRNFAKNLKN